LKDLLILFRSVVFWALVLVSTCLLGGISRSFSLFNGSKERQECFYRRVAVLWASFIVGISGVKVDVSGLDNIPPDTAVIYTPNHQSFFDIFILLKHLPYPFKFIIMRKLFNVPIIGEHITRCGFLPLDRKDRKRSLRTIKKVAASAREGESFLVFPEGQLTTTGRVNRFKRGASLIIQMSRRPVVPISIEGDFDVMPKGTWKIIPGRVRVRIGKPVRFNEYYGKYDKHMSRELGERLRGIVTGMMG
jgi:1-acyl-sn-glycerol-3-phosphate acyltransferase